MSEAERSIETTGPDEEVAIAAGLEQLGVGRDQVRIDVLDEARAGVMGLGSREARVRLTVTGDGRVAGADDEAAAPQVVEGGGMAEADTARQLLASLVAHLGIEDAEIDAHLAEAAPGEDEPPIVLDVRGVGTSALIGHHGRTLAALQRIVRLMVGQALSRHIHLVVDVDGFKAHREEVLKSMAQRVAEQAVREAETVVLEPMPAHERRVIHLALREDSRVTTESVGEGDRRRVSVIPHR